MTFNSIEEIKNAGFVGFNEVQEFSAQKIKLPKKQGIYLVLKLDSNPPAFLPVGTGGFFNDEDPNVTIQELQSNWINNTIVLYIGKAGGEGLKSTLEKRLKAYLSFGRGKKSAHRGGKLIWQLASADKLVVCWKELPDEEPEVVEKIMLKDFKALFGMRPFANLNS